MNRHRTRREFFGISVSLVAAGLRAGWPAPLRPAVSQPPAASAERPRMRLSLSVRVAEKFDNKRESSMTIDELIHLAQRSGYQALCLRASQAGYTYARGGRPGYGPED